jgi:hypothetical protein
VLTGTVIVLFAYILFLGNFVPSADYGVVETRYASQSHESAIVSAKAHVPTLKDFAALKDEMGQKEVEKMMNAEIDMLGSAICVRPHDLAVKEFCYHKEFKPSTEWKPVYWKQTLPAGLTIRMNFATGIREAKLSENPRGDRRHEVAIKEEALDVSYPVAKLSDDEKKFMSEFELQMFKVYEAYMSDSASNLEHELEALKDVVSDFKAGVSLSMNAPISKSINLKSVDFLLKLFMAQKSITVSQYVGKILGVAVQNNQQAKMNLAERGPRDLLDTFLAIMNEEPRLRADGLLFIGNWVRGEPSLSLKLLDKTEKSKISRLALILSWDLEVDVKFRYHRRVMDLVTDSLGTFSEMADISESEVSQVLQTNKDSLLQFIATLQKELNGAFAKTTIDNEEKMKANEIHALKFLKESGLECLKALIIFSEKHYSTENLQLSEPYLTWRNDGFDTDKLLKSLNINLTRQ